MSDEPAANEPPTIDDDLVVRARMDRVAFGLLYDRYYPRVLRYCRRRLLERAAAEDVTSEVFLEVASHFFEFAGRTETDFRRWLFRIATNTVNAHLRQMRRRQELRETAARDGLWDRDDGSRGALAARHLLDWPAVHRALQELDDRNRTIVMLRFFCGAVARGDRRRRGVHTRRRANGPQSYALAPARAV